MEVCAAKTEQHHGQAKLLSVIVERMYMDIPQLLLGQVGTVQYSRTREQLDQQSFTALWDIDLVHSRLREYRMHTVHMAPAHRLSGRTERRAKREGPNEQSA
jgi:hypothetical protein